MKAAELRQSILWLAIQGKLVPQNDFDEPASKLLKRIADKKAELTPKAKKKKTNNAITFNFSDIPFDIPDSWEWCHLCDLGIFSSGKTPDMTNPLFWENATIPWITSKDMKAKWLCDSILKITESAQQGMVTYPKGTLLLVVRSGILKRMLPVCILSMDSTINQDVKAFSLFDRSMSSYVFYMLKGLEKHILENYTKQVTTVDSLCFSEFATEMPVPIPPQAEQKRIVSKLDELMALCDELEAEEKKLDALETHFAEYLPKSILQAAVQGALVPQNVHEEPASELLNRIQKEKDKLVKEGKIRKEKPLPVTEDEIPYDLPEGWVWARLIDIATINPRNCLPDTTVVSFLPMNLISQDYFGGHQQETRPWATVKKGFTHFAENDILIAKITPCFQNGKSCIARGLKSGYGAGTTELHVLRTIEVLPQYLLIFVKSPRFLETCTKNMTGTAGQQRVPTDYLLNYLVPLPPLSEQRRIVAKVDELMAYCNELKSAYTMPVELPKSKDVIKISAVETVEETLLAARGNVGHLSNEAMQAIDDLFAEDEE